MYWPSPRGVHVFGGPPPADALLLVVLLTDALLCEALRPPVPAVLPMPPTLDVPPVAAELLDGATLTSAPQANSPPAVVVTANINA